eukprot:232365-Amphidinium_carterae.1
MLYDRSSSANWAQAQVSSSYRHVSVSKRLDREGQLKFHALWNHSCNDFSYLLVLGAVDSVIALRMVASLCTEERCLWSFWQELETPDSV